MNHSLVVRPVDRADEAEWLRLRTALWPEWPDSHRREIADFLAAPPEKSACFVAEVDGRIVGFAESRLRDYAEECESSPVGYLEGIYVEAGVREVGVGRALVVATEEWARSLGCSEMASDREITNEASGAFHLAVGFEEAIRMVTYRKDLTREVSDE